MPERDFVMADIVAFPPKPEAAKPSERKRRGPGAEIVIFPGIRIERWVDEPVELRRQAKAATRRDRLEIGE